MTRLLIANRGEIVTRIARTARRLGMSVVTISSPVDSHAQWHRLADHTVLLDGDIPSEVLHRFGSNHCGRAGRGLRCRAPGLRIPLRRLRFR